MASVACALDANQWMAWQRRRRVQWRAPSRRSQGARVCQIHTFRYPLLILMVPAATQKKMGITVPVSVTTMLPTGTMWWLFLETCHARLRTTRSSCTIPNYLTDPSSINGRYGPLMSSLIRCTTVLDSTTVLRGMYPWCICVWHVVRVL